MKSRLLAAGIVGVLSMLLAADAPTTQPKAARSVHLWYPAGPAISFYGGVTVQKSQSDSYFEVCGFSGGYFGIQELDHGRKVGIFSVWDTSKGDDPKAVDPKDRVTTLYAGKGVRVHRFGGEGTGGHSDFDFDWKVGETYKLFVSSKITGDQTAYAAYIFDPAANSWFHVATFAAPDGGKHLTGLYSFIEDFRRDTTSATEVRRAKFGNQWAQTVDGKWEPLTRATFTASSGKGEASNTINAGIDGNDFFLQTGGDTKQETKLHDTLQRPNAATTRPAMPDVDWGN